MIDQNFEEHANATVGWIQFRLSQAQQFGEHPDWGLAIWALDLEEAARRLAHEALTRHREKLYERAEWAEARLRAIWELTRPPEDFE